MGKLDASEWNPPNHAEEEHKVKKVEGGTAYGNQQKNAEDRGGVKSHLSLKLMHFTQHYSKMKQFVTQIPPGQDTLFRSRNSWLVSPQGLPYPV